MTKLLSSLALVLGIFLSAACDVIDVAAQTQTGTFDRTLSVSGPASLDVRTGSGDIQIRVGVAGGIHVIGRIRARDYLMNDSAGARVSDIEKAPPIEQSDATVRIGHTGDNPLYRNVSISYEITVPPNTQIRSASGSGDQRIGSVQGSVAAQAGSGNIEIGEAGSDVRAHTGSGDIQIERAGGSVDAQAGSGDIVARGVGGAIRAQTGSGSIEMTQTTGADAYMQTGSGDVRLSVPGNASYDLAAQTGSGSITVAQPMTTRVQSRHRLEGSIRGGGGARIAVKTGSGSISIR